MALKDKPNSELFRLYDNELLLRLHNPKNLRDTRHILARFNAFIGEAQPSPEGAKAFLAQYADRQSRTRYRYAQMIKTFMAWYGEPLDDIRIKIPKTLPSYTEDIDVKKLLAAAADKRSYKNVIERDQLLIETIWRTGLRRGEASNLRKRDIYEHRLIVRGGKGGKDRSIPLLPSLAAKLATFTAKKQADERVFGLGAPVVSMKIKQLARKAGLSTMHAHALRHKFATDLLERGANIRQVQVLMGHENLNTTQVYLGVTDAHLVEAIGRLETTPAETKPGSFSSTCTYEASTVVTLNPPPFHTKLISDTLVAWAPYVLPLISPNIVVDSLTFQNSDPDVPFEPAVFTAEAPEDGTLWDEENIMPVIKRIRKRLYTWQPVRPLPYQPRDGGKYLYGAVSIGQRPMRFDISPDKDADIWSRYYGSPVEIKIKLRYSLNHT